MTMRLESYAMATALLAETARDLSDTVTDRDKRIAESDARVQAMIQKLDACLYPPSPVQEC
jgi:uncharacterized coiled-coil protein SlyX